MNIKRLFNSLAPFLLFLVEGVALANTGVVPSYVPSADSALIEQAKRDAAREGGVLGTQTFKIDAQGNPVLGADGEPVMQGLSPESMKESLRMFQKDTGLEGVDPTSSPSSASKTGKASLRVNQAFDFSCNDKINENILYGAGALAFKVAACQPNASKGVGKVSFRICDNPANGGSCGADSDFDDTVAVTANTYGSYKGLELGLGCDAKTLDTAKCRMTVKGAYVIGGSDESMKADAGAAGSNSTIIQGLSNVVNSGDSSRLHNEVGNMLVDCQQLNADGANTGQYKSCNGEQTVAVATAQNNGTCGTAKQCLSESISTTNFTKTCVRTFPLTERTTKSEYPYTQSCLIKTFSASKYGTNSSSCGSNSGYTKVGETTAVCVQEDYSAPLPPAGSNKPLPPKVCVAWEKTAYWVNLTNFRQLSKTDSPYVGTNTCDNTESRLVQCDSEWFGRTRDLNDCTVSFQLTPGETIQGGLDFLSPGGAGCGFCLRPTVRQTCRAASPLQTTSGNAGNADVDPTDTCAGMDLAGCTFSGATPLDLTGDNGSGLVAAQRESWACVKKVAECVKWSAGSNDASCLSQNMAMGTDSLNFANPADTGSLNNALVAAALVDGTAKGVEDCVRQDEAEGGDKRLCKGDEHQKVPLIFVGEALKCKRPVGAIGSVVAKNCCRTDLQRPKKGVLTQAGCDMNETKLAAARRSSYAHYVGDYCSKKLPWPFKTCIERKQSYCVFQGILPRIVHEQGREQLAAMTSSSVNASVQETTTTFGYHDAGGGGWSTPVEVNGVKVTAWKWPSYCSDPGKAAEMRVTNPSAFECPSVVATWFAACDKQGGCGPLPSEPEEGSLDWTLRPVDSLVNKTAAISKYAVVTGACAPSSQQCTYKVGAWPVGIGGKAVVTKDLNWALFSESVQGQTSAVGANVFQMNNVGDLMFKMYPTKGTLGAPAPSTVPLAFSRDGGQTWVDVQLPTTSLKTSDMALPGGTDVRITGSCDSASNMCSYRVTGSVTVTAKSWGSAENPDCSGFTAGQLAVMDFSKMDLSEWLATIMDKAGAANPTAMAANANKQFQDFSSLFQQGKVKGDAPVMANFARVVPPEGFGPFDARLAVSGIWPEPTGDAAADTEKVTRVEVDWGDCSPIEQLSPVASSEGTGFRGLHRYEVPDADKHNCLKTGAGDNLERNISHKIVLKAYTTKNASGYTRNLSVENAWAKFPGGNSNNDVVKKETEVLAPGVGIPQPPQVVRP